MTNSKLFRGVNWNQKRLEAIKRDKVCVFCNNPNISVHHIIPYFISFDNTLSNLICLCNKCHTKEDNFYRQHKRPSNKIIKYIIK